MLSHARIAITALAVASCGLSEPPEPLIYVSHDGCRNPALCSDNSQTIEQFFITPSEGSYLALLTILSAVDGGQVEEVDSGVYRRCVPAAPACFGRVVPWGCDDGQPEPQCSFCGCARCQEEPWWTVAGCRDRADGGDPP